MRASCSIIIPGVTTTSATSAIGASTRIACGGATGCCDAQPDSGRAERRSYPSPGDREWLDRLDGADYVVFSVSAELPDRDVPAHLVELAVAHLLLPVLVGRHYPRLGRREQRVRHRGVPVCSPYAGRRGGAPVARLRQ